MNARRLAALSIVLSLLAGPMLAQDTAAPATPMPKAGPILDLLPAGSMGFVVANNVQALLTGTEKFLTDLGVAEQVGIKTPGSLLAMMKQMAQLGPGFNPNGGAAAVMLDPQQFGVDLLAVMGMGGDPPKEEVKLPFVLLLAGTSIKEVFDKYETSEAGEFTQVKLRMGPMMAKKSGQYILLSPDGKYITALLEAKEKAASGLSKSEAAAIAAADVAYCMNMKVAGPFLKKVLASSQAMMGPALDGPGGGVMKMYLDFYGKMIGQMQSITFGARLTPTGVVIDELVTFLPHSDYGKMAALYAQTAQPLLDRLPNLPYVLAAGYQMGDKGRAEAVKASNDMIDNLLASDVAKPLSDELKARLRKSASVSMEQIEGLQVVGGGAPQGSGVFGVAVVAQVKDAEAYKAAVADGISAGVDAMKLLIGQDEIKDLKVEYVKGAETIGSVSVDALVFTHPEMEKMSKEDKDKLAKALGEDKVRVFLAAKNKTTVVMTFGGGKAFLAEALKAADGAGPIPTSPGMADVMKMMPRQPSFLAAFNLGNLMTTIEKGMTVMGEEEKLPFKFTSKMPIAFGGGVQDTTIHVVVFLPTDVIKDVVEAVMSQMQPKEVPGKAPAGKKDF